MPMMNISAQEFKARVGTYLRAAADGEVVRVRSRGQIQAMLVAAEGNLVFEGAKVASLKGSPAALVRKILLRNRRPRIKGRSAAEMVRDDRE